MASFFSPAIVNAAKKNESASPKEIRLIVGYKKNVGGQAREKTHRRLLTKFEKHFVSINADLVKFKVVGKTNPERSIEILCEKYLAQKDVEFCEADHKITFPTPEICSQAQASLSVVSDVADVTSQSQNLSCEVVPSRGLTPAQDPNRPGKDGLWRVSPLWGQQAVGADLAAEFVTQRLQAGRASLVPTGNVDLNSDRTTSAPVQPDALRLNLRRSNGTQLHGDQAADLVSNPPFGPTPAVTWSAIVNLLPPNNGSRTTRDAWNSNLIAGLEAIGHTRTRIVSASIGYWGSAPRASIDALVDRGQMFVQAAGNDFPLPSWGGPNPRTGHIVVGSVGPNGIQTPSSQEPVKIYAPADEVQLSGPNERFGGTSGGTPLVTGSIVNALAILPGLTNLEIEELLARTSLPSFSQRAASYGPGLLNSYRMAVVAACLADRNPAQSGTPTLLDEDTCFDQSAKARELQTEADRLLRNPACINQRDGLKALRASFLLQPTRDTALRIAEIYERLGFPGDGRWYRTAAATLGTSAQQRQHFSDLLSEPSLAEHRYFSGLSWDTTSRGMYALSLASRLPNNEPLVRTTIDHIERLANSDNSENHAQAMRQSAIVGPRALPAISRLLVDDENVENPRSARGLISLLTMQGTTRHQWVEETANFFRGTIHEKHLPSR